MPLWKDIASQPEKGKPKQEGEEARELIKLMNDPDVWWVWMLGRPNPANFHKRPRYHLGLLPSHLSRKEAVDRAKKGWPQHVGNMLVSKTKK